MGPRILLAVVLLLAPSCARNRDDRPAPAPGPAASPGPATSPGPTPAAESAAAPTPPAASASAPPATGIAGTPESTPAETPAKLKADENDAISDVPLGGAGVLDTVGLGGGAAGAYGWRDGGGRRKAVLAGGGVLTRDRAINRALGWLRRHQTVNGKTGRWECLRHGGSLDKEDQAARDYDVAVTSLAVLAFLGRGHTAKHSPHPPFQDAVGRAIAWLREQQGEDGSWSGLNYAQALAALIAAEHHGLTTDDRDMAQKAVDCLLARQNPRVGGWDYHSPDGGRTDTSISIWGVMALKSARIAGLEIGAGLERAQEHFRQAGGGGGSTVPDRIYYSLQDGEPADPGPGTAQLPAAALGLWYLGVTPDSPWLREAARRIAARGPNAADFYETYLSQLLLEFALGPGNDEWNDYRGQLTETMLEAQETEGDDAGSWDPAGRRYGPRGGRVYTTALGAMILTYYMAYYPVYEDIEE